MGALSLNSGAAAHPHREDVPHSQLEAIGPPELLEALQRTMEAFLEAVFRNNFVDRLYVSKLLAKVKDKNGKLAIAKNLDGMRGYLNHRKIGKPAVYASVTMSEDHFREFSALLKRNGIEFSGVMDVNGREVTNRVIYTLKCRPDDYIAMKKILDLLNDEQLNSVMAGDEFRAMDEITKGKHEDALSKDERTKKVGEATAKKIADTNQITDVINRSHMPQDRN